MADEFNEDMTNISGFSPSSIDGSLGAALSELQQMQVAPGCSVTDLRLEPVDDNAVKGKGKAGVRVKVVRLHISGFGFGTDEGRVMLLDHPVQSAVNVCMNGKPKAGKIISWTDTKIIVSLKPNRTHCKFSVVKADDEVCANLGIPIEFISGPSNQIRPATWSVTETEETPEGLVFRGTNLSLVEALYLLDDTLPVSETKASIISQTSTELIVAWPVGQVTPLERALLTAGLGLQTSEVIASDVDVDAGNVWWPGGWTQPPSVSGWSARRESNGDIVVLFTGSKLGIDEGTLKLITDSGITIANVRSWTDTVIEVDAVQNTTYTDFNITSLFGEPVVEIGVIDKPIITPADLATLSTMDSPAINTLELGGSGFDGLKCVECNSPTLGVILVFNEDPVVDILGEGATANLANGITVTWSDVSIVMTSISFGGETFNAAILYDISGTGNDSISVPVFTIPATPAGPTITSYTLTGANNNIMQIAGSSLDDLDDLRVTFNLRRDSNDAIGASDTIYAVRPGSNAESGVGTPAEDFFRTLNLMNNMKSWSDTLIEVYVPVGRVPDGGWYTADFVEQGATYTNPERQGRVVSFTNAVPNGSDMKDDPTGRGAVPEFLNATLRDVGRNLFNGWQTAHTITLDASTDKVTFLLNQVSRPVAAEDISGFRYFIETASGGKTGYIYNEATDLHDWDDPDTPAIRNAAQGITVNAWSGANLEITFAGDVEVGDRFQIIFPDAHGSQTFLLAQTIYAT